MSQKNILLSLLCLLLCQSSILAQEYFRIRADISIKDKLSNGSTRLTVGKAYYDKPTSKLVYKLSFPQVETALIKDTLLYKFDKTGGYVSSQPVFVANELSIFHLALSGKLADYGLSTGNTAGLYKISKVEKSPDGRVLTTWQITEKRLMNILGNIQMATQNKRLDAIAFFDPTGKLLSQQFFKDYTNVSGLEFPQVVTQITYNTDGTQNLQQTTYRNIIINQNEEDAIYTMPVPTVLKPLPNKAGEGTK